MVPFGSRGIHGENPQYHAELSIILHVALGVEKDDLFTCGSDNQLWHKWVDDSGTLHEWESLRGRLTSGPAAISVTIGKIDVFVRGTDGALWEDTLTRGDSGRGKWSGWTYYGGKSLSGPSACSDGPDHLEVFTFGEDHNIWHTSKGNAGWEPLDPPPSPTRLYSDSNPSAVAWQNNKISVFARADDGSIWVRTWEFNPFTGKRTLFDWKSWGGISISGPAACYIIDSSRVDIFVRGQDKAIWHIYGNPQIDDKYTVKMGSLYGEWESEPSVLTTHDPWAISPKKWSWHLITTKSIEIDHERSSWHAGRVHDLLVLGGSFGDTLLVGSAYSGVWIIRPADWSASCLSEDWDRPDVNCLATGSTTSIFAGCGSDGGLNGALYESVNGIYSPWYSIPLHPNIKTIFEIVVWEKAKIIVLACYGGIFWSAIPARGGTYDWKSADWNDAGLKTTEPPSCYSVTMGKDGDGRDVIFVGAFNTHSGNRGIFIGSLERIGGDDRPGTGSRILAIRRVSISTSGFDSINMHRVSLASCKSNRKVIYALSVDDKGKPNSVLKTVDGGRTWTLCKTTLKVKDGTKQITDSDYGNNEQGGIIHKISVSPSDSNVVAFGVLSPFVSYDGGQIWQRLDKWEGNLDTHEDIHKIIILGGETFYILSDGGIAYTNDKGSSIHSYCNKNLSNLLLYSTLTRGFLGRIFASYQFPNLVGGGLQDNSNSYLEPASWGTAWKKVRSHGGTLEGGDGGQMLSLRTGRFVADRTLNDRYPRVATWDPSKKIFQIGETIKVQDLQHVYSQYWHLQRLC